MCGIAGILKFNGVVESETIHKMNTALKHRGPDGTGIWINTNKTIGLGHRRLSIIDLSANGAQPMHYADHQLSITFNGEIYNYIELKKTLSAAGYIFKTDTDTEVLLAMYHWKGENMLQYLEGMFAFAIWNEKKQELFCARDRYGEKPFYYYHSNNVFYFASEMKALFSAGILVNIDAEMVGNYLMNDLVINPNNKFQTFYSAVKKLPKSTYIIIKKDSAHVHQTYYQIKTDLCNIKADEAADKLKSLLTKSVSLCMRSDVPVGSSLSGGLDSSIIVYLIQQNLIQNNSQKNNVTFSARFDELGYNENEYLDSIVNQLNLTNHSVFPNENLIHNDLEKVFYHQEEPFQSASILNQWTVMQLAKNNNTTVLLDGQGADETLGGYNWYYKIYLQELLKKSKKEYNEEIKEMKKNGFNYGEIGPSETLNVRLNSVYKRLVKLKYYLSKKGIYPTFPGNAIWPNIISSEYVDFKNHGYPKIDSYPTDLNLTLKLDHDNYILESLLRFSDRNAMAFSREVRLPYLNHEFVNFCFSLPSKYKMHHGWTKWILRESFKNDIPKKIIERKDKIGFGAPQSKWMNDPKNLSYVNDCWVDLQNRNIILKNIPLEKKHHWKALMLANMVKFSETKF